MNAIQTGNHPRVSVIMPAYNGAKTIAESINSVISQTYSDWELIICDDGSTDNTYEIAASYAEKYPDVILLRNERNLGEGATRNHCISHARGEYIAFLDCDDISLPERFREQVDFLDENPEYALVGTLGVYFDDQGEWGTVKCPEIPTAEASAIRAQHICASAMMRGSVLDKVGLYKSEKHYIYGVDQELFCRIYAAGFKGYNIQKNLYRYRFDRKNNAIQKLGARISYTRVTLECVHMLKLPLIYYIKAFKLLATYFIPRPLKNIYWNRKKARE